MAEQVSKSRPVFLGLAASLLLTVLIIVGSRKLEHYDSALFGYTVASIVALGAVVFRYAIWLQRPATRVYWRRGWQLYLQRERFLQNTASAANRRLRDRGAIALQQFTLDFVPHMLLIAISVTGLMYHADLLSFHIC